MHRATFADERVSHDAAEHASSAAAFEPLDAHEQMVDAEVQLPRWISTACNVA